MRKSFLVLIFLFFTFSILNAKPLKTEAELQNIRNKADKIVQEELKNDYKKEYLKRKEENGELFSYTNASMCVMYRDEELPGKATRNLQKYLDTCRW